MSRPTQESLDLAQEWIETTLGSMYPDESWPYSLATLLDDVMKCKQCGGKGWSEERGSFDSLPEQAQCEHCANHLKGNER